MSKYTLTPEEIRNAYHKGYYKNKDKNEEGEGRKKQLTIILKSCKDCPYLNIKPNKFRRFRCKKTRRVIYSLFTFPEWCPLEVKKDGDR